LKVHRLTQALLESGRKYNCEKCGLGDRWNNEKIVLQVDHKNGHNLDNSESNLRFLCPNCHSQTENWCFKNSEKYKKPKTPKISKSKIEKQIKECICCRKEFILLNATQTFCSTACRGILGRKNRPSQKELIELRQIKTITELGKLYDVSPKTIRNWLNTAR